MLEEDIVKKYDILERPFMTIKDPDLWDKIYNSVEFEATHVK